MFDQSSREKKQRNWKLLNLNPLPPQDHSHPNRSIIADPTKKYCPRKNSSQQKIFSKSKERLTFFKQQNPDPQPVESPSVDLDASQILSFLTNNAVLNPNGKIKKSEVKYDERYYRLPPHQSRTPNKTQFSVHQDYQTGKRPKGKQIQMKSFQFEQIFGLSKPEQKNAPTNQSLQERINQNSQIVAELREKFLIFKQIVMKELEDERENLRLSVLRMADEFMFMREKVREELLQEMYQRQTPVSGCFRHIKNNSTDIRLQGAVMSSHFSDGNDSLNMINLNTFGKIEQSNHGTPSGSGTPFGTENAFGSKFEEIARMEENLEFAINEREEFGIQNNSNFEKSTQKNVQQEVNQKPQINPNQMSSVGSGQKNHQFGTETQISQGGVVKEILTKELRTYKSSGNFTPASFNYPQSPQALTSQANTASQYMSQFQSIGNIKRFQDASDKKQRFSEILKKQYEEKTRNLAQMTKIDKGKISERLNHVQKFQGAMQKLKSEIMEFKNLSDTKDIQKIKFTQQRPSEKCLKEILLNEKVVPQYLIQDEGKGA